jgi:hypothetical protein
VSHYCGGVPVRAQVRVHSEEAVRAIEEEVLATEKRTGPAQSAAASLQAWVAFTEVSARDPADGC